MFHVFHHCFVGVGQLGAFQVCTHVGDDGCEVVVVVVVMEVHKPRGLAVERDV